MTSPMPANDSDNVTNEDPRVVAAVEEAVAGTALGRMHTIEQQRATIEGLRKNLEWLRTDTTKAMSGMVQERLRFVPVMNEAHEALLAAQREDYEGRLAKAAGGEYDEVASLKKVMNACDARLAAQKLQQRGLVMGMEARLDMATETIRKKNEEIAEMKAASLAMGQEREASMEVVFKCVRSDLEHLEKLLRLPGMQGHGCNWGEIIEQAGRLLGERVSLAAEFEKTKGVLRVAELERDAGVKEDRRLLAEMFERATVTREQAAELERTKKELEKTKKELEETKGELRLAKAQNEARAQNGDGAPADPKRPRME